MPAHVPVDELDAASERVCVSYGLRRRSESSADAKQVYRYQNLILCVSALNERRNKRGETNERILLRTDVSRYGQ